MATVIYHKELTQSEDTADWVAEGHIARVVDPYVGTILGHLDPESLGDHAHWTYWVPEVLSLIHI